MQDHEDRDPALTAALRALADEDGQSGASEMVEARLLREVRSISRARQRGKYMAVFAIAAALVLAVSVSVWRFTRDAVPDPAAPQAVAAREVTTAFFPLIHSQVDLTGGQIVRMELPRRALAAFGLGSGTSIDGSAPGTVLADVIVGQDGLARAVRFVQPVRQE